MVLAELSQIADCYEELTKELQQLNQCKEAAAGINRGLRMLSGTDEVRRNLAKSVQEMEVQVLKLLQMQRALDRLLSCYSQCEETIIRKFEEEPERKLKFYTGYNEWASMTELLKDIIIQ